MGVAGLMAPRPASVMASILGRVLGRPSAVALSLGRAVLRHEDLVCV